MKSSVASWYHTLKQLDGVCFCSLLQFPVVMSIEFPDNFQHFLDYVRMLKGDILGYLNIKCAVPLNLYSEFVLAMLIIPSAVALTLIARKSTFRLPRSEVTVGNRGVSTISTLSVGLRDGVASDSMPAHHDASRVSGKESWDTVISRLSVLVFLVYPFLATRVFHMFACRQLSGGESFHQYDYTIDCTGLTYLRFKGLAALCVVIYPCGVPILMFALLYRNRERLEQAYLGNETFEAEDELSTLNGATRLSVRSTSTVTTTSPARPWWFGDRETFDFIVAEFRPEFWFFETIDLFRKLSLTGLLMVAEQGSATQILLGTFVAFSGAIGIAIVRPYADSQVNVFRMLVDASLFVTLLCILVLHFRKDLRCEFLDEITVGYILITVNFVLLLLAGSQTLIRRLILLRLSSSARLSGVMYKPNQALDKKAVYLGEFRATAEADTLQCAVKIRPLAARSTSAIEVGVMSKFTHPNICRLYRSEEVRGHYYLALELCDGCLEKAVYHGVLREQSTDQLISACRGLVLGVQHLHHGRYIHGNIAPSNCLVVATAGLDLTFKLAGFNAAARIPIDSSEVTLDTIRGTAGYQPAEVIRTRKSKGPIVTLQDGVAVDTFALGSTLAFTLSKGSHAFAGKGDFGSQTDTWENVEKAIVMGEHDLKDRADLTAEARDLVALMVEIEPSTRPQLTSVLSHPLFWSIPDKLKYLGETVGSVLPSRKHKSLVPFIADLEDQMDDALGGPFNYDDPDAGTSWARLLDPRYPLAGADNDGWGSGKMAQRPPAEVELHYAIYGAPAKSKQIKQRTDLLAAGKPLGPHTATETRSVGLLRFIRNLDAHAVQMVSAGRFESEDALQHYLLDPFPWLLMAVYRADMKHQLTVSQATETASTTNPLNGGGTSVVNEATTRDSTTTESSPAEIPGGEPVGPPPDLAVVGDITAL